MYPPVTADNQRHRAANPTRTKARQRRKQIVIIERENEINSQSRRETVTGKTPYKTCLPLPVRGRTRCRGSPSGGSRVTLDTL